MLVGRDRDSLLVGLVVVFALAGTAFLALADASRPGDIVNFSIAGATLLSSHALHAFADPRIQAGPLELALARVADWIGGGSRAGLAVVVDVGVMAAACGVALRLLGRRPLGLAAFVVASFLLLVPGDPYRGHPAEPVVGLLWLLAAHEARRGRLVGAGAMVGLSACFELWGVLGVAVFVLAPALRDGLEAVALAVLIPVALLAPFLLGGDFHMFRFHWVVQNGLPALLAGSGQRFTWPMRLVEGVAIAIPAGLAGLALRSRPQAVYVVPGLIALLRIGLDPVSNAYYWDTPAVVAAMGAAACVLAVRERRALARVDEGRDVVPALPVGASRLA